MSVDFFFILLLGFICIGFGILFILFIIPRPFLAIEDSIGEVIGLLWFLSSIKKFILLLFILMALLSILFIFGLLLLLLLLLLKYILLLFLLKEFIISPLFKLFILFEYKILLLFTLYGFFWRFIGFIL